MSHNRPVRSCAAAHHRSFRVSWDGSTATDFNDNNFIFWFVVEKGGEDKTIYSAVSLLRENASMDINLSQSN
jgi:hypothetical protein